ncbi:hypothetical protein [Aliamphritea spongicola]|nr:hypothetical protein [Aliamphritea spongicola]
MQIFALTGQRAVVIMGNPQQVATADVCFRGFIDAELSLIKEQNIRAFR